MRRATEGCKEGNCLRSHINSTETYTSLAMVTKAGVKSNKVVVGIASYGRSFQMEKSGCAGPDCKFTGSSSQSDAEPGKCTKTGGVSRKNPSSQDMDTALTYHNSTSPTPRFATSFLTAPTSTVA
jgi:GH18 family chitinase